MQVQQQWVVHWASAAVRSGVMSEVIHSQVEEVMMVLTMPTRESAIVPLDASSRRKINNDLIAPNCERTGI
jgi:hypothetical protein